MMRNFIIVVNILALTLPFLAAEVQSPDPTVAEVQNQEQLACRENSETLYDQKRVRHTPVRYVMRRNLPYEPSYFHYRPSVAVIPYTYHPFVMKQLLLRALAQISQWQPMPNVPRPIRVHHPIPSPSFLAIPTNENEENTVIRTVDTIAPVESTAVPITETVMPTVANPEVSTVPINTPEATTVPVSSPAA